MIKRGMKRALALLLSLSIAAGGPNLTARAATDNGNAETVAESVAGFPGELSSSGEVTEDQAETVIETESFYEGDGFNVSFRIQDRWADGYNATVKVENTSDSVIENWVLGFDFQGEIANIWNAVLESSEDGKFVVKNAGWNQDVAVGQYVEFGLNGVGEFVAFPNDYRLIGQLENCDEEAYEVTFEVTDNWNEGFNANVTIANHAENTIEDWVLEFDFDAEITNVWNGTILSSEDGHYVIQNAGYNANVLANEFVSFGMQGKFAGEVCEPTNYVLSSYGEKEGKQEEQQEEQDYSDVQIVMNAYSKLKIGYADGNDRYSVTDNVGLPTELDGASITWISSKPEVISETGAVRRSEETQFVTLKAVIQSNNFSKDLDFELRVIKNTYENYDTDYIYDMDSLELLYVYNDDPDELEVYLSDEGYVEEITGKFSEFIVESPEEALLALYEVKSLMGCDDPKEQLQWESTGKNKYGYYFSFQQVYEGIPVYGRTIVVSTDLEGNTKSLHSSFIPELEIDVNNVISEAEVKAVIENNNYEYVASEGLVIYEKNGIHLSHNVCCKQNGMNYNVLVDAKTGDILLANLRTLTDNLISFTGKDEYGVTQTISVNEIPNKTNYGDYAYSIDDYVRNVKYHDLKGDGDPSHWPGPAIASLSNSWTSEEISAVVSMNKVFDYWLNTLEREGYDGERGEFHFSINLGDNNSYSQGNKIVFGQKSSYYTRAAQAGVDTVGHEFTHSVISVATSLAAHYENAPAAINEGYCDIFGYFAEGDNDPDWNHGEDNHSSPIRIISDPWKKQMPAQIGDKYYYDFVANGLGSDYGGAHTNNSLVSLPCYLMWKNGITDKDRLATLWYTSLSKNYDGTSTFDSVRLEVLRAAKSMSMSGDEIEIIKDAFDAVGIYGATPASVPGTNVVLGKVVEADMDMIAGNDFPLIDAKVTLTRSGSKDVLTETTIADGTFGFYDLRPGTYTLTVKKSGYWDTEQTITLTKAKLTNYCETIELIPMKYMGLGVASGTIRDAITGVGVEGLTVRARRGMNSMSGKIMGEVQTESQGKYEITLDTGLYCIEVIDKRTLPSGQKNYYSTYFNVKVLGGITVPDQNATVSNAIAADQLRIVLEWGAAPADLDSHLTGPTSSGSSFHVYYSNKSYSESGVKIADLDLDDRNGYGPETTTIYHPLDGNYVFYVYNWSQSPDIKTSSATVKVYTGNNNKPAYSFAVPLKGNGLYWVVFSYDSKTRKITPINSISSVSP